MGIWILFVLKTLGYSETILSEVGLRRMAAINKNTLSYFEDCCEIQRERKSLLKRDSGSILSLG
jgi:hypothetical protein